MYKPLPKHTVEKRFNICSENVKKETDLCSLWIYVSMPQHASTEGYAEFMGKKLKDYYRLNRKGSCDLLESSRTLSKAVVITHLNSTVLVVRGNIEDSLFICIFQESKREDFLQNLLYGALRSAFLVLYLSFIQQRLAQGFLFPG